MLKPSISTILSISGPGNGLNLDLPQQFRTRTMAMGDLVTGLNQVICHALRDPGIELVVRMAAKETWWQFHHGKPGNSMAKQGDLNGITRGFNKTPRI